MGLFVDIEKKLKDMTLQVRFDTSSHQGITGILGASGCGKSMTLKSIAGIITPDRGRIVLNGRVLYDSEKRINCSVQDRHVGYLFQNYALFPHMTVYQNIQIAAAGTGAEKEKLCRFYMDLLQIRELAGHNPSRLSGGQQQRVALARILASGPEVLMLDEPFSSMDAYLKESLQIELLDILNTYQGEILMVTHSRDEIYRFCDRVHVLDQGKLVASGATKEVFQNPQIVAAARLTGCKNIVPVRRISEHQLEVPDWNRSLYVEQSIPEETEYIGIRAHYLQPAGADTPGNVIRCRWKKLLEEPFEMTAILEEGIWWKISKEDWNKVCHRQLPEYLRLPEDSILMLRKE